MYIYIRFLEAFANFYFLFLIFCLDTNTILLEPVHDLGLIFFFQEKGSMFVDFLLNFDDFSGGVKFLETSPKIGKVGVFNPTL